MNVTTAKGKRIIKTIVNPFQISFSSTVEKMRLNISAASVIPLLLLAAAGTSGFVPSPADVTEVITFFKRKVSVTAFKLI